MYCIKCEYNTETVNTTYSVTKNNRNMVKGNCANAVELNVSSLRAPKVATSLAC
jgi:Domain of unknown function (DUF5679)